MAVSENRVPGVDDNPVDGMGSAPKLSVKSKYFGCFNILLLPYIGSKNNSQVALKIQQSFPIYD